jgi:glycosyltransferase involved in cell wall biosynthesis
VSLVVVDADVLGRQRTGDETYVRNLLRTLPTPAAAAGLRLAAVTRRPELVPDGVEAVVLSSGMQELRMAWTLPRALRRLGASLVHTQYAVPLRCPCPAVVTIHDLSFEYGLMGRRDRVVFERVVPRAARSAARVLTVSERTKRDIVAQYGVPAERVVVTPNGVDPAFGPAAKLPVREADRGKGSGETGRFPQLGPPADQAGDRRSQTPYALAVGAIQARKNQRAALAAAREAGLELVVVGPTKDERIAAELRTGGARLEGYVPTERLADLYRGAACLVQASRHEGFGLPVVEAMASGTPVVTVADPALVEVAGDAAVVVAENGLADGIRRALAERDRLAAAGLERARSFSWEATARATVGVYVEVLGA